MEYRLPLRKRVLSTGFTMTEMMVVISILSIMLAMGIPMYLRELPNYRLREAARQIVQDMNFAKMRAVATNQNYCIYFNISGATVQGTDNQCYTLFRDSGAVAGQLDAGDLREKMNWPLPDDITIVATTFPNNTVVFRPRANSNGGTITLRNRYGHTKTVEVLANTGRVKIL
jgi:type IV fimbrial biogenesis protein FimT